MQDLIASLGVWTWWIVAVVLFVLELLAPGIFFLWLGLSAIVVGILELFVDLPWQAEVGLFSVLSVISLIVSRKYVAGRETETDRPHLNQRMQGHIGKSLVLETPIVNGRGKIKIDDTFWTVRGHDAEAGSWIRLSGVDGSEFLVEPAKGPDG